MAKYVKIEVPIQDALEDITVDEMMECFLDYYDEILDIIGKDFAMEHFGLVEPTEDKDNG